MKISTIEIIAVIAGIITVATSIFDYYGVIFYNLIAHPFFSGVVISWFFALLSTGVVLFIANIGKNEKKVEYNKVFRQSEMWLQKITIFVLFYIAINLASKAFYAIGIPIFGEPYDRSGLLEHIAPHDIFLGSLAVCIVILIFLVAPSIRFPDTLPIPEVSKTHKMLCFLRNRSLRINTICLFFVLSILISLIATFIFDDLFSLLSLQNFDMPPLKEEPSDFNLFLLIFSISFIFFIYFLLKTKIQRKNIRDDFRDLLLFFCFMPAILVASLVLAEDDLVRFPNIFGNFVVGVLLISGFFTIVTLTTISFSLEENVWDIWRCLLSASLAAISGFSALFLWLPFQEIEKFREILSFAVAIMILILLYGFLYEKMKKYQFTEWWRREWRPVAMIVSILVLLVVGAINPEIYLFSIDAEFEDDLNNSITSEKLEDIFKDKGFLLSEDATITKGKKNEWVITDEESFIVRKEDEKLNIYPETTAGWGVPEIIQWGVPCKLVWVFIALSFMFCLPWIRGIWKFGISKYAYEVFKNWERPPVLPKYQGMVLVKAETCPGKLNELVKGLSGIEGVYQTMVVRGVYDVCLIIEGIDSDDIAKKILEIRKTKGVADTTTLTDISESFDREVRYK